MHQAANLPADFSAAEVEAPLTGRGHAPPGKKCHHLHEYYLTCDEYDRLRARAGGCCEICGVSEDTIYRQLLLIDHCYETGKARGLVCAGCNAVMACHDGRKRWGANRRFEEHARRYVERFEATLRPKEADGG